MSTNQWVHQKDTYMYKENYTTGKENDVFKESETYMYMHGGEVGDQRPLLGSL